MKKTFCLMAIFIFVFLSMYGDGFSTRRALLVGIGNYPQESGWHRIGSINDIDTLTRTLSPFFQIRCLVDKEATHDGIARALDRLIADTNAGDTVLVHFSCHGQQMLTNNPDEPDHLDETLVPYDAFAAENEGYHGENHFKDDELAAKMESLRERLSGKGLLMVCLDACHSGNSIRGGESRPDSLCRGSNDIFGVNPMSDLADELEMIRYARDTTELSEEGTPVVYISACQSTERNYEFLLEDNSRIGSLSYSLNEAVRETGLDDVDILLDRINSNMKKHAPRQTPQFKSSFGYAPVEEEQYTDVPTEVASEEKTDLFGNILKVSVAVVLLLLAFVIYGRRKQE